MGSVAHCEPFPGCSIWHERSWLDAAEAIELHTALLRELVWEQRAIVLFGRSILQPRLIAWAGDLPYRYSGQTLEPREAPRGLRNVMERVSERAAAAFNHVLVNRYRDGSDSMGMHADDEPELGPDPIVATLSLGATRRFVVAPRRGKASRLEYALSNGDLLIMGRTCQAHNRHGIPKTTAVVGERVSLTFRNVVCASDPENPT
jgi:alkylated DNA repair dioxygenase AlkB